MSAAALLAVAALAGGPAQGAVRLETTTQLQRSAERVWPTPHEATGDRSRAHTDGCLVGFGFPRSPPCVYGHKRGRTTLVLFGDSHALQYFSAFERVALDRRWRLVLLAKAGCALGPRHTRIVGRVNGACSAWREHSLRRIARLPKPTLVVATGATYYHLYEDGRRLDPAPSRRALARGVATTLRRLTPIATRVAFVRDALQPPPGIPECVAAKMHDLRRCAFPRASALPRPDLITRSAEGVPRVRVIDPIPQICPTRMCPAVIGDVLVWRRGGHITATYAGTMARWFAQRLPITLPRPPRSR